MRRSRSDPRYRRSGWMNKDDCLHVAVAEEGWRMSGPDRDVMSGGGTQKGKCEALADGDQSISTWCVLGWRWARGEKLTRRRATRERCDLLELERRPLGLRLTGNKLHAFRASVVPLDSNSDLHDQLQQEAMDAPEGSQRKKGKGKVCIGDFMVGGTLLTSDLRLLVGRRREGKRPRSLRRRR